MNSGTLIWKVMLVGLSKYIYVAFSRDLCNFGVLFVAV